MIIVVSDIHLGYAKSNPESFRKFLEQCAEIEIEHFIILGDLMDFWRANIAQVITDHHDILDQIGHLKAANIHYLPGNHDYYIHRLAERYPDHYPFKVSNRLRLKDGGSSFNFVHGHELELYANFEPMSLDLYERASERMCFTERITGGIATRIWDFLENRNDMSRKADVIRRPPDERASIDRVHELAISKGAYLLLGMQPSDKLVYGHTHKPFINKEKTVANTGSWVVEGPADRLRNTYVRIEKGEMELRRFGIDSFP